MKFYATVTSERASKGQGGNDYLDVLLTRENGTPFVYVKVLPVGKYDPNHAVCTITAGGEVIYDAIITLSSKDRSEHQKGERQKGEHVHEYHNGECSCGELENF